MPWSVTIVVAGCERGSQRSSMGSSEEVREALDEAIPGIDWTEHAGVSGIANSFQGLGNDPFLERLRGMIKERGSEGQVRGLLQSAGVGMEFYGFEQYPVRYVHVDVRGSGNPMQFFRRICNDTGWSIVDDATSEPIDLTADVPPGWDEFTNWRDEKLGGMDDRQEE